MKTLVRIAVALEQIAKELHIFNLPSAPKETAPKVIDKVKLNVERDVIMSKRNAHNASQPRWTLQEIKALRNCIEQGMTGQEMAKVIGRSSHACTSKALVMGWGVRNGRKNRTIQWN